MVLVGDENSMKYIRHSGHGLLPSKVGQTSALSPAAIGKLSATAQKASASHGAWIADVEVDMVWEEHVDEWALTAWSVQPADDTGRGGRHHPGPLG